MSAEAVQACASIAGLVLALIGLPILFLEIRGVRNALDGSPILRHRLAENRHACSDALAACDGEAPGVTSS